jgi:hypothetical protein
MDMGTSEQKERLYTFLNTYDLAALATMKYLDSPFEFHPAIVQLEHMVIIGANYGEKTV